MQCYLFNRILIRLRLDVRYTVCATVTDIKLRKIVSFIKVKMQSRQALLLSSSNCHGFTMLGFAKQEITSLLKKNNVNDLIFVPYAQNDYNSYTAKIKEVIEPWGFKVSGIHSYPDPANVIISSKAIFIGGGNTFLLLKRLYDNNLVELIRKRVNEGNLLYIGSSAGTNVATRSIHTTNDMPIVCPPSFDAIGIVPFNINPHYIDTVEVETHKGETRDQRISEYLEMPYAGPVLGLKEGSMLQINDHTLQIQGVSGAVLFRKNSKKIEIPVGADVSYLYEVKDIC